MMKTLVALVVVVFLAVHCKKNQTTVIDSPLVGGWESVLNDTTSVDGTGIGFLEDGNLRIFKNHIQDSQYVYVRFAIVNDSIVNFIKRDNQSLAVKYHMSNNFALHLEGACVLNCVEDFGRVLPL